MTDVERQSCAVCKNFGDRRWLRGRGEQRRRGHLDSAGSDGGYEYIYTQPHTIPPPPFHFAVKTPSYTPTPQIFTNKKRQPKPAFPPPPTPITLCRPQQLFGLYQSYDSYHLQPLFPLFQGVPPSRPNQTLLHQPLHIGCPTHEQT